MKGKTAVRKFLTSVVAPLLLMPAAAVHAQTGQDAKIAAYERAIQALQDQIDQMKKDVASLKAKPAAQASPSGPQLFGYTQAQFESTAPKGASRLFLRRVRVGVRGQLERGFSYYSQADLAASTGILRDAWIDYTGPRPGLPIARFGQYKLPYSLESFESDSGIPFIERAIVVEQLASNHDRDSGIALMSRTDPRRPYWYMVGVENGQGINQFGAARSKLVTARVQVNTPSSMPLFGGTLAAGFSTRQGRVNNLTLPAGSQREDERYGADADYLNSRVHVRGEYLWGRNQGVKPSGYYGLIGFRPTKPLEILARYEGFSVSDHGPNVHRATFGLSYLFSSSTKGMLNYESVTGVAPSSQGSGLRLRLQTVFP